MTNVTARIARRRPAGSPPVFLFSGDETVANPSAGVAELRQRWRVLRVVESKRNVVFHSGELDGQGELRPGAIRFADKNGKKTYQPWEISRLQSRQSIPPKGFSLDTVTVDVPANFSGELTVKARIRYRSAAPLVAKEFMGNRR